MSTIIMSQCWMLQGLSVTQKAVLISLADQASDDGVCWALTETSMDKDLTPDHIVLYAEFRKGRGTPSPGVVTQFDQITKDMLAQARSTHVVATMIRAELGLPELP